MKLNGNLEVAGQVKAVRKPLIKGDDPKSGPPGPDYVWVNDTVNYTYGKWVKVK